MIVATDYNRFIQNKHTQIEPVGFDVPRQLINSEQEIFDELLR